MRVKRRKDKGTVLEKYRKSFFHALDGIIYAVKHEQNMKIIILAIITVVAFGIYFEISTFEWFICLLLFGSITASELLNSAIEATVDLITLETNSLGKIAKDTASGATLVLSITAFIIGLMIFIPKIF